MSNNSPSEFLLFTYRRIVNEWNKLPASVVESTSVNTSKNRLDRHWKDIGVFSRPATQPINYKYKYKTKIATVVLTTVHINSDNSHITVIHYIRKKHTYTLPPIIWQQIKLHFLWAVGCWRGYLSVGADLHMAQLMPLPPCTVSCFSKVQIGFTFLAPAHLGSPGQKGPLSGCYCCC